MNTKPDTKIKKEETWSRKKQKKKSDLIYGLHSIIEGIKAGTSISKIFVSKSKQSLFNNKRDNAPSILYKELMVLIKKHQIPISTVPIEKINRLLYGVKTTQSHQGVVGFVAPISFGNLSSIIQECYEKSKYPTILVLDNITDVGNFGAIVRTASCTGIDAIVICSKGGALVSGDAMRSSCGALAHIPICREQSLSQILRYLKTSGLEIIALSEKGDKLISEAELDKPVAIILGSEDKGIDENNLKICDTILKIPIEGPISSLNVSVAAGIACYEVYKQRLDKVN